MVGSARWSVYPWSVIMCTAEMACVSVCVLSPSTFSLSTYVRHSCTFCVVRVCIPVATVGRSTRGCNRVSCLSRMVGTWHEEGTHALNLSVQH